MAGNLANVLEGLSPRGRGNLNPFGVRVHDRGSIPAWAGEPARLSLRIACPRVYPRVGGGTDGWKMGHPPAEGLSPRGRGNP